MRRIGNSLQPSVQPSTKTIWPMLGIGITVVLALWWLPKWQAAGSQGIGVENRFDRENEARKTLAQITAGVFVLAGLYSSVKTADLQRKSGDLQRDTENLQREGQITDRFTKAIDQLGAMTNGADGKPQPNVEVRLGGIYALERIAKDSPKDQWTIMEVLTAYVRQNAPTRKWNKRTKSEVTVCLTSDVKSPSKLRADIQAVLVVIGRRDTQHDLSRSRRNLRYADLSETDLSELDFSGVDFSQADLSETYLSGAKLIGGA